MHAEMRWGCSAAEVIFSNRVFSTFFALGKVIPVVRGWGARQPGIDFLIGKSSRYPLLLNRFLELVFGINFEHTFALSLSCGP
jgi:hypothetical protein